MKSKLNFVILIILLNCIATNIYSQDTLIKTFKNKRTNDVKKINNNLFLLSGVNYPKGYFLYLDSNFNIVSDLSYNDVIDHQFAFKETVLINSRLYTTGFCSANDLIGEYYKSFIGCLDINGNLIWQYKFDTTNYDYMGIQIKYVNNLLHVLTGKNIEDKYSRANITILDTNSNILKSKDFLDTTFKYNQPNGFFALQDSSYIILLFRQFQKTAPLNYTNQLIKIDKNLDTLYTKNIIQANAGELKPLVPTVDGNFLIGGTNLLPSSFQRNSVLFKYDTNLNLLWLKQFSTDTNFNETINTIDEMPDKSIIICTANSQQNLTLIKLDSLGNTIWTNNLSINSLVDKIAITKIFSTNNNGYYIFGNNYFIPNDTTISNYIIAIKSDSNGNFEYATSINSITKQSFKLSIYPNPTNDLLNISSELPFININIMNLSGQVIKSFPSYTKQINLLDITPNIYFLKVNYKDGYKIIKFVKN